MNAPVDVTNIRVETPRLILRAWRETDLADFYAYASVDGVGQMAGFLPHTSIAESEAVLARFLAGKRTLALELKESGHVIGSLGLEERGDHPEIPPGMLGRELGFALAKPYWGRGLMPEAVSAMLDYCFSVLDFDFVTCGHFTWNHQSQRVIEKCGFRFLKAFSHQTRMGTLEHLKLYIKYNPKHQGDGHV